MTFGLFNNFLSSGSGNLASRAAIGDRDYDDVITKAEASGLDLEKLASRLADKAQKRSQNEARFQQGVVMENQAFSRGINADQMRQATYNSMATNEQQNRADLAKSLLSDYSNARNSAAQLMANTLRF